jgi:predicted transcriptional regulator
MSSAAALIKRSRHAAGLTQAELARRVDVTQPVIARLEREGANPRLETLDRVIAATGHSLELTAGPSAGLDETMIAANLRLEPRERLRQFAAAYRSVSDLARKATHVDGP